MITINEITDEPRQRHMLTIESNVRAELTLEYFPEQYGWFFTLIWGDFAAYNERVVCSHNLLRQYSKTLPFGIAVTTTNGLDPMTQDCFSSQLAALHVLTEADVLDVEAYLYG